MLTEIINNLPHLIGAIPFLPDIAKKLLAAELKKAVARTQPEQLQAINDLIETWINAVGARDFEAISILFTRCNVTPGGIIERVTARLMGMNLDPVGQVYTIPKEMLKPGQPIDIEINGGMSGAYPSSRE